jgi:hypothetical protein
LNTNYSSATRRLGPSSSTPNCAPSFKVVCLFPSIVVNWKVWQMHSATLLLVDDNRTSTSLHPLPTHFLCLHQEYMFLWGLRP